MKCTEEYRRMRYIPWTEKNKKSTNSVLNTVLN